VLLFVIAAQDCAIDFGAIVQCCHVFFKTVHNRHSRPEARVGKGFNISSVLRQSVHHLTVYFSRLYFVF
jgi:hypothetical protein